MQLADRQFQMLERQAVLKAERLKYQLPEETQDRKDLADQAHGSENEDERIIHLERIDKELRVIQDALNRISAGTYGICRDCGETIDDSRLKALPQAPKCRYCANKSESTKSYRLPDGQHFSDPNMIRSS